METRTTPFGVKGVRDCYWIASGMLAFIFVVLSTFPSLANETIHTDADIARLIADLGADNYYTRTRATEKLQLLGLEAFDDLHDAQFHSDNEIAMAARFLISSLLVSWSKDSDPPPVQEALSEYGAQDELERSSRIDILAELPDRAGLLALVRLTRFESSLRLSRLAALAAMRQPIGGDQALRRRSAEQIQQTLGDSNRQSAEWMRAYAEDLKNGRYSDARWRELISGQRRQVDAGATDASNRQSVLELVRICATRASLAGLQDEALRLAVDNIDLIAPTTRDLIDACSWAIDNDLHPFVLRLMETQQRMFDQHPILLYGAAESEIAANNDERANELAERASQIRPLPTDEPSRAQLQPKQIEEIAQAHRMIAGNLRRRGLFHWAEREYQLVIDALEIDDATAASARLEVANMFSELERHQDVIDVLKPLNDRLEKDAKLQAKLNSPLFSNNNVKSELQYHTAIMLIKSGDLDAARPMLMDAFERNTINIDILIRMYRTPGDEAWRRSVMHRLNVATRQSEMLIQRARLRAKQFGGQVDAAVANAYNQYAWLISNTEGQYQQALDYSLKSLEFKADSESKAARLDTCARCYFAIGNLDKAIQTQKQAIKLLPHSPPLQRQLKEFEQAKEDAQRDDE